MSQTPAFDIRNSQKLRSVSKKYERPAPPENPDAPTPAPRINIFERMDIAGNSRHDSSLRAIIDVVPDTRYPLLFIIFHVIKLYVDKEQSAAPLMTPATFTAYCIYLLYGFMLLNDYHGRTSPSFYASDFMDNDSRSQLFEHLKNAYVPPFMLSLFHGLTDTSDPRRPGLQYFATFAGSRFITDFGRIIPPQIFLAMHNISAEQDTSRPGINAMNLLMSQIIFYIGTTVNTNPIHAALYFGAATPVGTYRNWLYQAVLTLFSPVTGKSLLRRTNIEPVNLFPTWISNAQTSTNSARTNNLYTMFLNANSKNVKASQNFIVEFSNIAKSLYDAKFQLGAIPDDLSGVSILTHGYSEFAMPTWHYTTFTDSATGHKSIESATYATHIKYLQDVAYAKKQDLKYPADATTITKFLYLVSNIAHDADSEPSSDTIKIFDEEIHVSPPVQWLQPYSQGDQAISYSAVSGLLIESYEIDGTSVPLPDPSIGMRHANNLFLQGSLPLSHVYQAASTQGFHPASRAVTKHNQQKISIDFCNMAENRLPQFDKDTSDPSMPTEIPGFTLVEHVRQIAQSFTKLSFMSNAAPPATKRFHVWSPYRYVVDEEDSIPTENQILMLFNHRCFYGTSVPLTGTEHPSALIPTS
jgi:hypothetical protein